MFKWMRKKFRVATYNLYQILLQTIILSTYIFIINVLYLFFFFFRLKKNLYLIWLDRYAKHVYIIIYKSYWSLSHVAYTWINCTIYITINVRNIDKIILLACNFIKNLSRLDAFYFKQYKECKELFQILYYFKKLIRIK